MSKELTKEEHYEERKRLYNQFKTDNPQTIGETDKAFDNDNFIDWLVDNQNTKPLIEEIAELKAEVNNLTNANDEYFKVNKQLESELKASKSEANEAVESQEDILRELISLIQTSSSVGIIMQKFTITRNNK